MKVTTCMNEHDYGTVSEGMGVINPGYEEGWGDGIAPDWDV